MARKHGWQGWAPPSFTSAGNATAHAGFGLAGTLGAGLQVSFANIPHRRWLYGVDLVRGEITLLAAPGGVGKSSLALGIGVALATGSALLKERVWDAPLTSLYVNAEDSAVEMRRRIWAFCLHHGVTEQDLNRFLLLGADDWRVQKLSFLRSEKGASLLDEVGIQHLESLLDELRPDVLVLDPMVALCGGGNLNDNAAMSLVMRALRRRQDWWHGPSDIAGLGDPVQRARAGQSDQHSSPGVPPKLGKKHRVFLARLVEDGPIPSIHGTDVQPSAGYTKVTSRFWGSQFFGVDV